ncbi:Hypothetical_protein [Hexamita inflata]|uniref:Hypothetical_protein n=1 Tax=Hexamita inflata TaxID=28002 RepID=A0AA86TWK4_9EUKA|nr:Hypothetical protein HINF_LOCUS19229 [Hexamita inflata]
MFSKYQPQQNEYNQQYIPTSKLQLKSSKLLDYLKNEIENQKTNNRLEQYNNKCFKSWVQAQSYIPQSEFEYLTPKEIMKFNQKQNEQGGEVDSGNDENVD